MSDQSETPAETVGKNQGTEEPRNVAVAVLKNRTKIGPALCAKGPCSIPLTKSEAEDLHALGLVKITGIFRKR